MKQKSNLKNKTDDVLANFDFTCIILENILVKLLKSKIKDIYSSIWQKKKVLHKEENTSLPTECSTDLCKGKVIELYLQCIKGTCYLQTLFCK
jgi:hypothetical protein